MEAWKDASAPAAAPVRGLVRRAASTADFRTQRFPPGPELAPWVEYLWTVDWDLGDRPPVDSSVISFPALHVTAEWGRPGEVRHGHPLPATLVHGSVSRVFRVRLQRRRMRSSAPVSTSTAPSPGPASRRPSSATAPSRPPSLPGPLPADLHSALAGLPPAERAAAFDAALAAHRPAAGPTTPGSARWSSRMAGRPGAAPRRAARRRSPAARCARCSGASAGTSASRPKWALARFRLQEAALALEQDPQPDLAALAARLGWYDQAHLTNDLRRMLGETPARYACARAPVSAAGPVRSPPGCSR